MAVGTYPGSCTTNFLGAVATDARSTLRSIGVAPINLPSSRTLAPVGSDSTESTKAPEGTGPFRPCGVATATADDAVGATGGPTDATCEDRTGSSGRIAT